MILEKKAQNLPGKDNIEVCITGLNKPGLEALEHALLSARTPANLCFVYEVSSDAPMLQIRFGDDEVIDISKPVRVGHVLDVVERLNTRTKREGPDEIQIGQWVLDIAYNMLTKPGGEEFKLTEKETAILQSLYHHGEMSKESLLRAVWEYAEDVETHTLETHIYRLRQKIESDPGAPELVVTTDKGYVIKA